MCTYEKDIGKPPVCTHECTGCMFDKGFEPALDKWTELRETIRELHENNTDKPDVENVTKFLLNLMDVLDEKRSE